jgi:peptidoglycan/LPS O-acetylase OafA/YrhL
MSLSVDPRASAPDSLTDSTQATQATAAARAIPSNRRGDFYVPAFDGLRALCISAVLMRHVKTIPQLQWIETRGWYGVDVFFVLSGFLITWILAGELDADGTIRVSRFYLRRALRLQPAFFSALLCTLVFQALFDSGGLNGTLHDLPYLLSYTFNFAMAFGIARRTPIVVAWSLCIEEQFYLIWPLVLRLLGVRRGLWFAISAVVGVGVIRTILYAWLNRGHFYVPSASSYGFLYYFTLTRVDTIFAGCALALALKEPRIGNKLRTIASSLWYPGAASLCAIVLIYWGTGSGEGGGWRGLTLGGTVMAISVAGVVLALFVRADSVISRVLSTKPLVFVGRISYGIYLFHVLTWRVLRPHFDAPTSGPAVRALALPVVLALSIFVAWLHYRYVEDYFLSIRRVLETRRLGSSLGEVNRAKIV